MQSPLCAVFFSYPIRRRAETANLRVVKAKTRQSPLAQAVDDYLASCRARGLSPRTVDGAYGYPLRHVFLPFCEERSIREISAITPRELDRLATGLMEREGRTGKHMSKHSVHAYMRAVNHFLGWAAEGGEEVKAKAPLPRLPKKLIEVLSREEVQRLEDAAKTERDKLVVRVLADTGIRVGELAGLRPSDLIVQGRNQYLKVQGKGARERLVPVPPGLFRRLQRYSDRSRPKDTHSDRLFLSLRRSTNGDYEPLTGSGVGQLLKVLTEVAGVKKRVYPHLMRHSFATWTLTRGMNPLTLAQILGHSSLVMIQNVYAHLTPSDAYDALLKAFATDRDG